MSKKYWVVGSLAGLLMLAGFGCGGPAANQNQPVGTPQQNQNSNGQPAAGLINPQGDINAALSENDRQQFMSDAKNVATSIFGSGIKLNGLTNFDMVAKGSISVLYSTPQPIQANQMDALINGFQAAGYTTSHSEAASGVGNNTSSVFITEKNNIVVTVAFEPGKKEVDFMAMSKDQYTYLINHDTGDQSGTQGQ